jgi:hypothetical protein
VSQGSEAASIESFNWPGLFPKSATDVPTIVKSAADDVDFGRAMISLIVFTDMKVPAAIPESPEEQEKRRL